MNDFFVFTKYISENFITFKNRAIFSSPSKNYYDVKETKSFALHYILWISNARLNVFNSFNNKKSKRKLNIVESTKKLFSNAIEIKLSINLNNLFRIHVTHERRYESSSKWLILSEYTFKTTIKPLELFSFQTYWRLHYIMFICQKVFILQNFLVLCTMFLFEFSCLNF